MRYFNNIILQKTLFLLIVVIAAISGFLLYEQKNRSALAKDVVAEQTSELLGVKLRSGKVLSFSVEVASSFEQRKIGLQSRDSMPENHAMLFLFGEEKPVKMWMKDTKIPLDILFIDKSGMVVQIRRDAVPFSEEVIPSVYPAYAALEINAGLAEKNNMMLGDKVIHPSFE